MPQPSRKRWHPFLWHDILFAARYQHLGRMPYNRYITPVLYLPIVTVVFGVGISAWCAMVGTLHWATHPEPLPWTQACKHAFNVPVLLGALGISMLFALVRYSERRVVARKPAWQGYTAWSTAQLNGYTLASFGVHAVLFGLWIGGVKML